jgi:hypothetical protein
MVEEIIGRLPYLTASQLGRLENELRRERQRRASSAGGGGDASHVQESAAPPVTEVLEYRPYEDGYLQLELRQQTRSRRLGQWSESARRLMLFRLDNRNVPSKRTPNLLQKPFYFTCTSPAVALLVRNCYERENKLRRGSNRPHTVLRTFDEKGMEALRETLHSTLGATHVAKKEGRGVRRPWASGSGIMLVVERDDPLHIGD